MIAAFPHAEPLTGFVGGLMIGSAAALMLLGLGRIAGVSGLAARALGLAQGGAPRLVAMAFVAGLPMGAAFVQLASGPVRATYPGALTMVAAGLLVGYGTRLGSGCTSGHGICGLSRLSRRSVLATALFMTSGILTVSLLRLVGAM